MEHALVPVTERYWPERTTSITPTSETAVPGTDRCTMRGLLCPVPVTRVHRCS